jgi:hypothetical protein
MRTSEIAATGAEVAVELGNGDRDAALRLALDFVRVFDRTAAVRRRSAVTPGPLPTGDARYDALLAALVEHLCAGDALEVPGWVDEPDRFLEEIDPCARSSRKRRSVARRTIT